MSKDVQLEGVSRDAVVLALKDFYKENPDVSKDTLRNEIVSIVDRLATSRSTRGHGTTIMDTQGVSYTLEDFVELTLVDALFLGKRK